MYGPQRRPIGRGFGVQHRGRFLHLGDVVGGADGLILLEGLLVADIGAAAARIIRVDVDVALLARRDDHLVLRHGLDIGDLLGRIRLKAHEARR